MILTLQDLYLHIILAKFLWQSSGVNPLDQHHNRYWDSLVNDFYENVAQLDNYAVGFLNDYFRNIRVWVAFDLLEKLKTLKSRAVITNLIKNKYDDILMSLSSQVRLVIFTRHFKFFQLIIYATGGHRFVLHTNFPS